MLVVAKSDPDIDDARLAAELYEYGRQGLSGYKVPKKIAYLEALPRSHFGKILKRDLREKVYDRIY